jgi:hypothetical protein
MILSTTLMLASSEESATEGMLFYLVNGGRELVRRGASIVFDRGRVICRDQDGNDLCVFASAELAFVTHGSVSPALNVWI